MQPDRLSDEQLDDLAAELAPRLPTGTHGDRVILPRRTFAAAIGGTLGVGALTTLGVDRATAQAAGRQGTPDDPNDMFAWDLNVANQVTSDLPMGGHDVTGVGSLSAEVLTNDYLYVGGFTGADADARLDNAISEASDGGTIYIESAEYSSDRTVGKRLTIVGGGNRVTGASITGNWTFDESVTLCGVGRLVGDEGELTINEQHCVITRSYTGPDDTIQVNGDNFRYFGNRGGDITFSSGTSGGIVDACTDVAVTDNGTNTVGDIA